MPDLLGPVEVPTVKTPDDLAGDPLLTRLGKFIVAGLVSDANLLGAWSQVSKTVTPIAAWFVHDPEDENFAGFTPNDLPAFWLYRHDTQPMVNVARGWPFQRSTLHFRYVPEPMEPERQTDRAGMNNAVRACLATLIDRGRTPSFRFPNDPEPQAQYRGSFVPNWLGIRRMWLGKTEKKPLRLIDRKSTAQRTRQTMLSYVTEILIEETFRRTLPQDGIHTNRGVEGTILASHPPTLVVETFEFVFAATSISPATAVAGTPATITLTGKYIVPDLQVLIGDVSAENITIVSEVSATFTTPADLVAGTYDVTFINGDSDRKTLTAALTIT